MTSTPYVADREAALEAVRLVDNLGVGAGAAAARHANRSRDLGNVVHFCRWRQIERLVEVIAETQGTATRH